MAKIVGAIPVGPKLLIRPDALESLSAGGIVLSAKDLKAEQRAQVVGTVVHIGEQCWKDQTPPTPWCKIGDRIIYNRQSGQRLWDSEKGDFRDDMLFLNDLDVTAVITKEE